MNWPSNIEIFSYIYYDRCWFNMISHQKSSNHIRSNGVLTGNHGEKRTINHGFLQCGICLAGSHARRPQRSFYDVWNQDPSRPNFPQKLSRGWDRLGHLREDLWGKAEVSCNFPHHFCLKRIIETWVKHSLDQKSTPVSPPTPSPTPLAWILPLAKARVGSEMFGWDVLQMLCPECGRQQRCVWIRIPVGIWLIRTG